MVSPLPYLIGNFRDQPFMQRAANSGFEPGVSDAA